MDPAYKAAYNQRIFQEAFHDLRYAAQRGYAGRTKQTIENICTTGDPNCPKLQAQLLAMTDDKGMTALHIAAWYGTANVVRVLLDFGADPDVVSTDGWTPVDLTRSPEVRRMLTRKKHARALAEIVTASQHPDMQNVPRGKPIPAGLEHRIADFLELPPAAPDAAREGRIKETAQAVRDSNEARKEADALAAMKAGRSRSRKTRRRRTRRRK